jgi:hypothetical protein
MKGKTVLDSGSKLFIDWTRIKLKHRHGIDLSHGFVESFGGDGQNIMVERHC